MTVYYWFLVRSRLGTLIGLTCFLAANTCRGQLVPAGKPTIKGQAETVTALDKKVYDAVLAALRTRGDSTSARPFANRGYVMDHAEFFGFDPDKVKTVISARLGAEVQTDIERRGQKPVSLQGYTPDKLRLFSDAALRALRLKEDREARENGVTPDRGVILWLSLPGYSRDKRIALVDFRFDDGGRHGGGIGCCIVEYRGNRWNARWKQIMFRE